MVEADDTQMPGGAALGAENKIEGPEPV